MNKQFLKKILIIGSGIIGITAIVLGSISIANSIKDEQRRQREREEYEIAYQERLNGFIEENQTYQKGEVEVCFLGDSLTHGCDLSTYYPDFKTVNRGIGGDTTFTLENRLEASIGQLEPQIITMLIGGNNVYTMFDNYKNILDWFVNNTPKSKIVLLSLTALGQSWAEKNAQCIENNTRIKAYAEQYNFSYVDLYTPLLNTATGKIYDEYTVDGAHLTDQGYRVVSGVLTPVLNNLLNK